MKGFFAKVIMGVFIFSTLWAEGSWVDNFNGKGMGTFGFTSQVLLIGRTYDTEDISSGSVALNAKYTTPEWSGLSLFGRYVGAYAFFSNPDTSDETSRGEYRLSNDTYSIVNELALQYQIDMLKFIVGRQVVDASFVQAYNLRHKGQAFEAAILKFDNEKDLSVQVGHLESFSTWSSNNNDFKKMKEVIGVGYDVPGFQFIDVHYSGVDKFKFTAFDYIGMDLYNTVGLNVLYQIMEQGSNSYSLSLKYSYQNHLGDFDKVETVDAYGVEVSIPIKREGWSIEPGIFSRFGKGTLHTPFAPKVMVEEPLYEADYGFLEDNFTMFVMGTAGFGQHSFWWLYLHTIGESGKDIGEFNLVHTFKFTKAFYSKIKLAHIQDYGTSDARVLDYRLFLGCHF